MIRTCRIAVIVVALASPYSAWAQPVNAGAKRPNLHVLQDLPEAQLFPLMNLIATSLGVHCDYCHVQAKPDLSRTPANVGGWVWDRDDKPQKKIALDMMRMVVDLNAQHFGGRSRVTCVTCHRGGLDPMRMPSLPPPPAAGGHTAAATPLPAIDTVWSNYVKAVGSVGTPAPGSGTIITGWDDRPEGRYGKVEIIVANPDRYRITLTTTDSTTRQGINGDIAWAATSDRVTPLTGAADVQRMRAIAMRYRPLKERPANLQIVGVERVGDRDTYVARGRVDATTVRTLYFDVVTGLLRREMATTETLLLPLQEQVDYDDYREVTGVMMPFRVVTSSGAPYDTVTRLFLEIRRDVPVDETVFQPPPSIR
jgi:hypothetical protein